MIFRTASVSARSNLRAETLAVQKSMSQLRARSLMVAEYDSSFRPFCSKRPCRKASDLPWRGTSTRVVTGVAMSPADRNSAAKATVVGARPVVSQAARHLQGLTACLQGQADAAAV